MLKSATLFALLLIVYAVILKPISIVSLRRYMSSAVPSIPKSPAEWRAALASLPDTPDNIPAFFFGHGSPMLQWPKSVPPAMGGGALFEYTGPNGPLAQFLKDFGAALLEKYKPKGIVVFSAHWETSGERLVTDYGDTKAQPLLMDYFGFDPALYQLKFASHGSTALSNRVVDLFKAAGLSARTTPPTEPRGRDGRGFAGPGLDHGVFIPFRIMFGHEFTAVPIVQASIDASLSPEKNWELGQAVAKLREEGILVLSGGLTIHTFEDFSAFSESTAKPIFKSFDSAISDAVLQSSPEARKKALVDLTSHGGFRKAHPREEHFVPLYVAAGAGENGDAKIISGLYGAPTFAFGL